MTKNCDRTWEIDALRERRLGPKDAEAFERHLRVCALCAEAKESDERLRTLIASLPRTEPTELELRRLRSRVLRSAELGEERGLSANRMRFVVAAVFVGVTCLLVYFSTTRHSRRSSLAIATAMATAAPELAGTVSPHEGAVWRQTRDGSIERVKLDDGALSIHVRHQRDDERFFVDVPDGTVEVRGTTFDVDVRDGHTVLVHVTEGIVSWKPDRGEAVLLPAGASWSPTTSASSAAIVAPTTSNRTRTIAADDGSSAYAMAVSLFRQKNYAAASDAFGAYLAAHPRGANAEDASYLQAVSLAASGDTDAAEKTAEQHLAQYPTSFHRKEASILVARIARDHGDCAKARVVLAPWLGDPPDADARATLRSCGDSP